MSNIHKVWGERRRIHLDAHNEIDLLYVNKDCFCSTHTHKEKINKFIVISGKVVIETEYGQKILNKNESFEVHPPMKHRFKALDNSTMIEIAYTYKKVIDTFDINRESQGGRIVNGKEMTLDEMRKKGLLDL
jgi:quercetin dioxygenase-like cupin family protein